ncbi:hypothetical protein NM208_g10506 [Fusarium decemcellulare]|uniref:Uncharacterized protein n=1 Tax=Fusarium decemcellulare TaxID=57161 RepID=A0ACC1RXP1_9HYPO|nr:hypothetical protein NM208_g10506 [Fusarium decemcellulare]
MFPKQLLRLAVVISGMAGRASALPAKQPSCLRVENFINEGIGFNVVSSLIIGSESAVLVDVPIDIPHAEVLADWIRNTTDKPLVAVFTTHHHPDHNLGARAILDQFDEASFFASKNAVKHLIDETPQMSERMRLAFGRENITDNPALPSAYPNTFFTLSGHEDEPIHLINNVVGDTVDINMMWIPSQRILVAGDTVYHRSLHLWLADMDTTALSNSWLKTLDFISDLKPSRVIPGHAGTLNFNAAADIQHCRQYIRFFQTNIIARGPKFFTPTEIFDMFENEFPAQLEGPGAWASGMLLNNTAGKFGRDSTRAPDILDMSQYNDTDYLQNWIM